MSEPEEKRARTSIDLSLGAIIGHHVLGFVGQSPVGTASLAIVSHDSSDRVGVQLELRKECDAVSAPHIKIIKHERRSSIGKVVQVLALTPANSQWAAGWLVDHMEEKLIYTPRGAEVFDLEATLTIFELPPTTMKFCSDQSLPGPPWLQNFIDDTEGATPEELAQKVHIAAQNHEYQADRQRRLRSMARTWALVGMDAVPT